MQGVNELAMHLIANRLSGKKMRAAFLGDVNLILHSSTLMRDLNP